MDIERIQKICDDYIAYLESDEYFEDNDWENHIFETVLTAVFGVEIWDRIKEIGTRRRLKKLRDEINVIQIEIERLS